MNIRYSELINGRVPEANIQAEFYRLCRKHNIPILLEVSFEDCRFDAVIFQDDIPFAIIEVKNYSKKRSAIGLTKKGRQMKKYMRFGLPIIGVMSQKEIVPSFQRLLFLLEKHTP